MYVNALKSLHYSYSVYFCLETHIEHAGNLRSGVWPCDVQVKLHGASAEGYLGNISRCHLDVRYCLLANSVIFNDSMIHAVAKTSFIYTSFARTCS